MDCQVNNFITIRWVINLHFGQSVEWLLITGCCQQHSAFPGCLIPDLLVFSHQSSSSSSVRSGHIRGICCAHFLSSRCFSLASLVRPCATATERHDAVQSRAAVVVVGVHCRRPRLYLPAARCGCGCSDGGGGTVTVTVYWRCCSGEAGRGVLAMWTVLYWWILVPFYRFVSYAVSCLILSWCSAVGINSVFEGTLVIVTIIFCYRYTDPKELITFNIYIITMQIFLVVANV